MEEMMHDQIFDREYQSGRAALNDSLNRLIEGASNSLRVLHSIQFDAPWKRDARKQHRARAA